MEVFGKDSVMIEETKNVVYLSSLLNPEMEGNGSMSHKCDYKCHTEHIWGNIFRCKLTGITHICDKNCDQRIVYDQYSSFCRVSRQMFPLSDAEIKAVRGVVRRRAEAGDCVDPCSSKRRRESPFERSFYFASPIISQAGAGDGMDMN